MLLHATPFLPDPDLGETKGQWLTYSPSFVDVGRLRRRAQRMLVLGSKGERPVPVPVLQCICNELKSSIRGQVHVTAYQSGKVEITAADHKNTYTYGFTLNPLETT